MSQDRLLMWEFNRGSRRALRQIYEKYKDDLVTLAVALVNDKGAAEDVVHEVFLHLAGACGNSKLTRNLKGYLATCVANGARDMNCRQHRRQSVAMAERAAAIDSRSPGHHAVRAEELCQLNDCLRELPYEQREAISLHLFAGMKFKTIADVQRVSINTVQGRYRYGLNKLRSKLDGKRED